MTFVDSTESFTRTTHARETPGPYRRVMADPESPERAPEPVVLIVDDDDYVPATLSAALRELRPAIIRATTAEEGLTRALEHRPTVAIVDVGLPDMDGYVLTRRMRARAELAEMRICILTGHLPDEEAALAAGADAIIGKPFRLRTIVETIDELIRTSKAG